MKTRRNLTVVRTLAVTAILVGVFCLPSSSTGRQTQTTQTPQFFSVKGDVPVEVQFKTEDLDKMTQETAIVTEEEVPTKYTGVLLRTVLEKAAAPMGKTLRGKSLASYIVAKARDGYSVVFSLGELDEAFGNQKILLAYKREGKPLFGYQGPFRIVCPNDKAGARSLRMLDSIELVKLRK